MTPPSWWPSLSRYTLAVMKWMCRHIGRLVGGLLDFILQTCAAVVVSAASSVPTACSRACDCCKPLLADRRCSYCSHAIKASSAAMYSQAIALSHNSVVVTSANIALKVSHWKQNVAHTRTNASTESGSEFGMTVYDGISCVVSRFAALKRCLVCTS